MVLLSLAFALALHVGPPGRSTDLAHEVADRFLQARKLGSLRDWANIKFEEWSQSTNVFLSGPGPKRVRLWVDPKTYRVKLARIETPLRQVKSVKTQLLGSEAAVRRFLQRYLAPELSGRAFDLRVRFTPGKDAAVPEWAQAFSIARVWVAPHARPGRENSREFCYLKLLAQDGTLVEWLGELGKPVSR